MTAKPRTIRKEPLCERVLFVDGITRSGKKIACRLLAHLRGVEYFQFHSFIEQIVYLQRAGVVSREFAVPFLQYQVEERLYDRMIGRDLNTRESDESCVLNAPDSDDYFARGGMEGGMPAVHRFNEGRRIPLFHIHSVIAAADILFAAFPKMWFVHISRHPLDLAREWIDRGWGKREISDPLSFIPLVESAGSVVPWFAHDWAAEYLALNPAERAAESIMRQQADDDAGYRALDETRKQQVFRFAYEHLVGDANTIAAALARFLETEPLDEMPAFLSGGDGPAETPLETRRRKVGDMLAMMSPALAGKLVAAGARYDETWGLGPSYI